MSWYKDYSYRLPISLTTSVNQVSAIWHFRFNGSVPDSTSGAGDNSGIMSDLFWDTIDISGRDCVVTEADGVTLMGGWRWFPFDKAAREGRLTASSSASETYTLGDTKTCFLYFGGPSTLAAAPVTTGYELFGNCDLTRPQNLIVPCRLERSGATQPATSFPIIAGTASAGFDAVINVFWDVTEILAGRTGPYNRSMRFMEVIKFQCEAYDETGTIATTQIDNEKNTLIEYNGRTYCKTWVQALQSGTNYTLCLMIHTRTDVSSSTSRMQQFRCVIETINPVTPV